MDLSKIKLVAVDMDGTLLNSRHELDPAFYPVFDKMKELGVLFAVASGRQFYNLRNKFDSLQDDIIFIAENGSYVVYKNTELLVQAMPHTVTMEQLKEVENIPGAYPILCGKKKAYVEDQIPEFIANVKLYYDRYEVVDTLQSIADDEFLKIAVCDLAGAEGNSYHYFKNKENDLQVKVSGAIWLDLSHKLANKGRAINVLQNKYNITTEETMVFGDYLNDLEMMQSAYFSFAMENAHPDIKKVARFSAKSNDENGVTEILNQLVNSKGTVL